MSEDEYRRIFEHYEQNIELRQGLHAKYRENGIITQSFKEEVGRGIEGAFTDRIDTMLNNRGVACFSEIVDHPLMWSHYADGHRGFCLEFDTSYDPFLKSHKIEYRRTLPEVSPADMILNPKDVPFMAMATVKAECWAYEKEWRTFHAEPDKAYTYPVDCLTGIYFGEAIRPPHDRSASTKVAELSIVVKCGAVRRHGLRRQIHGLTSRRGVTRSLHP